MHPSADTPAPFVLSDDEITQALWRAGIPAAYHAKDRSLQTLQCSSASGAIDYLTIAKQRAQTGGCVEISFDGRMGMDFTFLLARALILRNIAACVVSLPTFVVKVMGRQEIRHAEWFEDLKEQDYLFVVGSLGGRQSPYDERHTYEAEWMMRSLLLNNKSLVLQGACPAKDCEWWSPGFRDLFLSNRVIEFFGPPPKAPPSHASVRSRSGMAS